MARLPKAARKTMVKPAKAQAPDGSTPPHPCYKDEVPPLGLGHSPVEGGGVQRTEINCHECTKNFVAELDFDVNGNYVIECAHCGHEHWRTIKDGKITESRWGSGNGATTRVSGRSVWKSSVIKAQTSTVSSFIRERWLNRSDYNGR